MSAWTSLDGRKPAKGRLCILWDPEYGTGTGYRDDNWAYGFRSSLAKDEFNTAVPATHWMYAPTPPKPLGKDGGEVKDEG